MFIIIDIRIYIFLLLPSNLDSDYEKKAAEIHETKMT